jgi:N-methylhydantoinase A
LAEQVRASRPEAIAVCLLFSFANPENENAVAAALSRLQLPLSISHCILPEFREYERMSTVVANAYLQPLMQRYLENLERQILSGTPGRVFVMQSNGGIASLRSAAAAPVRTILSGPAGGVIGAAAVARHNGLHRILSFDMGGTSTDVALVDGQPNAGNQGEVAGLPVGVPMLNIHTVGAGGGSLARFDAAGALRVGPESAGADPGPICYGRGTLPTVTDANLLLGRLQPHHFLGGSFVLDLQRTRALVAEWLKRQRSRLDPMQFAAGVVRVVNATMEKALRVVSIERGYDPRQFTLVAFGGAGGLHACELAQALRIPRVLVPPLPGALSAFGILMSDVVKDHSRTVLLRAGKQVPLRQLQDEFRSLRRIAEREVSGEGWKGTVRFEPTVDVRYRGQGHELNVPYSPKLREAFQREHLRRYGYRFESRELELVTVRLRTTVASPAISPSLAEDAGAAPGSTEHVFLFTSGKKMLAALHARDQLKPGRKYSGPAIILEYGATVYVPAGVRCERKHNGALTMYVGTSGMRKR